MLKYETPPEPTTEANDLAEVYRHVFAEPPYNEGDEQVREFIDNYAKQAEQPGFQLVTAREDGRLVGFAYGSAQPPGWWWRYCDTQPAEQLEQAAKFAVFEWAVLADHRGQGIGRALLDLLLTGRPEPWATLTVNPAVNAYRIYQRTGWSQVGISDRDGWPAMPVMVKRLG